MIMAPKKEHLLREAPDALAKDNLYDLATPLWTRYYRASRERIRFPRYYKRELNW